VLQAFVTHQGSGWSFAIEELRRYYERVAARGKRSDWQEGQDRLEVLHSGDAPPPFFAAIQQWYLSNAATLGKRTAELHVALTGPAASAFAPEPFDRGGLGEAANRFRARGDVSLDLLAGRLPALDDVSRSLPEEVVAGRGRCSNASMRFARSTTAVS
jgi:predicted trehalose synthase